METVAKGEAKYGVLPIENSSTGSITDIYDLLVEQDITIVAEHVLKVEQALLGKHGASVDDIKIVYSHPQGLLQCAPFLEQHNIQGEECASTAAAAKKVAQESDITHAAIASTRAAKEFDLEVLQESINFQSQNFTRFIIISNQKVFLHDANKISLVFELKHESGSLYNMLANFYYNDMNLTKIESRPIAGKSWEYRFFVDIEGNLNDSAVTNAMMTIQECASNLQILGNFATK
jgi:chorismate mutase/prephenate dehydratase